VNALRLVTFDPAAGLAPLTVDESDLCGTVGLYLRRVVSVPVAVVLDDEPRGAAYVEDQLVATFTVRPLGGER
jgi:hypothetical protein